METTMNPTSRAPRERRPSARAREVQEAKRAQEAAKEAAFEEFRARAFKKSTKAASLEAKKATVARVQ
jgi:hypothetical protein